MQKERDKDARKKKGEAGGKERDMRSETESPRPARRALMNAAPALRCIRALSVALVASRLPPRGPVCSGHAGSMVECVAGREQAYTSASALRLSALLFIDAFSLT